MIYHRNISLRKVIIMCLMFISCSSSVEKVNVENYPEISIFLEKCEIEKSENFISKGKVVFFVNTEGLNFLAYTDSIASLNSWETVMSDKHDRVYVKMIKSYPADNEMDTLFVDNIKPDNYMIVWE